MKHLQKLLLPLFILIGFVGYSQEVVQPTGQFIKPSNARGAIWNGLQVERELYLPLSDTNFTPLRAGAILVKASNKKTYQYNGTAWAELQGTGTTIINGTDSNQVKDIVQKKIDSSKRWAKSGIGAKVSVDADTLVFSVADYPSLIKSSSDPAYYFPLYSITGTQGTDQVPNVTGIKDSILIVSGAIGTRLLTISKGTQGIYNGKAFPLVLYHKAVNRYESYYAYSVGNGQIKISTPLRYAAVADTLHTVHDAYLGQHLTTYAARSWADHLYDFPKGYALKNNFYIFQPELNPSSTPLVDVGTVQRGGFITGTTDLPYYSEIVLRNVIPPQLAKYFYALYQKGKGVGVKWDVDLGGKTGYLEANIGLHRIPFAKTGGGTDTTRGLARVIVTIDGHADSIDVRAFDNQILRWPFTKATTGQIKIVTGDTNVTAIVINRIGWYNGVVDSTKIDFSGKGVVLGDSWTQFQNGQQDFTTRLNRLLIAAGITPIIINNGRSGMTSEWGRYWFKQLVLDLKPAWCAIEFGTNDAQSVEGNPVFNFSSASPFAAGGDVSGLVTPERYKENIEWMIEQCVANGIQPIIMTPAYGHDVLSELNSKIATNKFYEVKALTSSVINVDNAVTSKLMKTDSVSTNKIYVTDTMWIGRSDIGAGVIMSREIPNGVSGGVAVGFPTRHFGGDNFWVVNGPDKLFRVPNYGEQVYSMLGYKADERFTMKGLDWNASGINPEGIIHARAGSVNIDTSAASFGIYLKHRSGGSDSTQWKKLATVDTVQSLLSSKANQSTLVDSVTALKASITASKVTLHEGANVTIADSANAHIAYTIISHVDTETAGQIVANTNAIALKVSYKTVATYAAMIADGTPTAMTVYQVLSDTVNMSGGEGVYQKWPNGSIYQIAANKQ